MDKLNEPVLIKDFLDPNRAQFFHNYACLCHRNKDKFMEADFNAAGEHKLVPNYDFSIYSDPLTEVLMVEKIPFMEELTGKKLWPTYSYFRMYVHGSELKLHSDRFSCEYSVTAHWGSDGEPWPITVKGKTFDLKPGEAVIYKGIEWEHFREGPYTGDAYSQVFMHYVDKDGLYQDHKFDKRPIIGLKK